MIPFEVLSEVDKPMYYADNRRKRACLPDRQVGLYTTIYHLISMRFLMLVLIPLLFFGCREEQVYLPKPRMFPRVNFPEKNVTPFQTDYCDFKFAKPNYTRVIQDTAYFDETPVHPCWFDLFYPDFDARIHFSYYPIDQNNSFDKLRKDAFTLSQKHNIVANYIDEIPLKKNESVKGFIFDLEGEVASPVQFYLSDEKENFLRGSLYFNTQARPDSLAPIVAFIKEDILKFVDSFEWKDK